MARRSQGRPEGSRHPNRGSQPSDDASKLGDYGGVRRQAGQDDDGAAREAELGESGRGPGDDGGGQNYGSQFAEQGRTNRGHEPSNDRSDLPKPGHGAEYGRMSRTTETSAKHKEESAGKTGESSK